MFCKSSEFAMYCTKAESNFRPCSSKPISLDLFGPAGSCEVSYEELREPSQSSRSHCYSKAYSKAGNQSQMQLIPNAMSYENGRAGSNGFQELNQPWQKPKTLQGRLQEEDLIGRLDECVSDANSADYSTIDCTLSLGTPATRRTGNKQALPSIKPWTSPLMATDHLATDSSMDRNGIGPSECSGLYRWNNASSNMSLVPVDSRNMNFVNRKQTNLGKNYANIFNQQSISNVRMINKAGPNGSENASSAGRKCANCDTTTTPLWRNGPKGPKSLCNACGIRYKKEERRTAACAVSVSSTDHQTKKHANDIHGDIFENNYGILQLGTDDTSKETSCLTWQGNCESSILATSMAQQLQRPKSRAIDCSLIMNTENIRRRPTSAAGPDPEGGPMLLLGLSVNDN